MNTAGQLHSWNVTPAEAVTVQKMLCDQVVIQPLSGDIELIAGADISWNKFSDILYAAIVVLRLDTLEVIAHAGVTSTARFPYLPGLLSFREAPPLLEAWEKLSVRPDALMLDGQGIAHPRRFGIGSHIGLWLNLPTLGCAKTLLTGKYEEPALTAGSTSPLIDREETIGVVLRTKDRVNPVYISPGHLMDIPSAVDLATRCVRRDSVGRSKYRIPEPTRLAHLCVNSMRRGEEFVAPE